MSSGNVLDRDARKSQPSLCPLRHPSLHLQGQFPREGEANINRLKQKFESVFENHTDDLVIYRFNKYVQSFGFTSMITVAVYKRWI